MFGPTLQGEGPSTGIPATFVRLWGCNLDCSWCDTPYTWDTTGKNGVAYSRDQESSEVDPMELVESLPLAQLLVITGGEPLIQASALRQLIPAALALRGFPRVEIETNGTRPPLDPHPAVSYNVSPKLEHASTTRDSIEVDRLRAFLPHPAVYKFVAQAPRDLDEVAWIAEQVGIPPDRVWIMPEGRDEAEILSVQRELVDTVIARGWRMSTRLHVLLWGDRRRV